MQYYFLIYEKLLRKYSHFIITFGSKSLKNFKKKVKKKFLLQF